MTTNIAIGIRKPAGNLLTEVILAFDDFRILEE